MPTHVFADLRITRKESVVDDYFEILLYYPNARVRLKAGFIVREAVPSFVVHGYQGSFLKSRADVQEPNLLNGMRPNLTDWGTEPASEAGLLHTEKNGETVRERVPSLQGNYYDYYNGVYQSLTQDIAMPVTVDDGIRVMTIIEAAIKSSSTKRVVEL